MPSLVVVDGNIVGFNQNDLTSAESHAYLVKALNLNAEIPYLKMRALYDEGRILKSYGTLASHLKDFPIYVTKEEGLIRESDGRLWMNFYGSLFYDYLRIKEYEKAYNLLGWLQKFEPKGENYTHDYDILWRWMKLEKVPIPTQWEIKDPDA